jgi:hypothetical protein
LLASASAKSWDKGVGVAVPGVCAKAENAAASANVMVANKETTFIRELQSQVQFKAFAKSTQTRVRSRQK